MTEPGDLSEDVTSLIAKTWEECGVLRVRPLRNMVFVRTELLPEYIGSIFIPATLRASYSQLPHKVMLSALVIGAGPKCTSVKIGDRVSFSRLFFARWQEMSDKCLVGWLQEENIAVALDNEMSLRQAGDFLQTPSGERAAAMR